MKGQKKNVKMENLIESIFFISIFMSENFSSLTEKEPSVLIHVNLSYLTSCKEPGFNSLFEKDIDIEILMLFK